MHTANFAVIAGISLIHVASLTGVAGISLMHNMETLACVTGIPLIPVISVLATDYRQYRGRRD